MKTLGLDIGTTTISAVVLENGAELDSLTLPNGGFLTGCAPWERIQDPLAIRATVMQAVEALFACYPDIRAIGAGCLILEVQEPTDFTIQPEHWCGEYHLNDQEMYLGLDKDTALDCFRFDLYGESAVEQGRKKPAIFYENGGLKVETLIGEADTPCFSMRRYLLERAASRWISLPPSGYARQARAAWRRTVSAGSFTWAITSSFRRLPRENALFPASTGSRSCAAWAANKQKKAPAALLRRRN